MTVRRSMVIARIVLGLKSCFSPPCLGGRALESADNFASQLVGAAGMDARGVPLVAMTFYFHPFPKDTYFPHISLNPNLSQRTELYRLAGLGE